MDEKIAIAQQSAEDISNPKVRLAVSSKPKSMKAESRSSPDQEEIEREYTQAGVKHQSESRASPGVFLSIKENESNQAMEEDDDDHSEEAQAVDDIAMSPLPYDREDPVTLLDLPDDILVIPISPCGPHDEPALS